MARSFYTFDCPRCGVEWHAEEKEAERLLESLHRPLKSSSALCDKCAGFERQQPPAVPKVAEGPKLEIPLDVDCMSSEDVQALVVRALAAPRP